MGDKSIKDFIEKRGASLAMPCILFLIGLFFIVYPGSAIDITVKLIGIIFIIVGAFVACTLIVSYSSLLLVLAIVLVGVGLSCIALSSSIATIILKIVGVLIVASGIMSLLDVYKIKNKTDKFVWYVIINVLTIILGAVIVFIPMNVATAIVRMLGIFMAVMGVINIFNKYTVYREGRYINDGSDVVWEE